MISNELDQGEKKAPTAERSHLLNSEKRGKEIIS